MTSLGEEFEIVSNYLKVQKLRFGRRLDYRLDFPEGLGATRVPAMILQPFVENAVIHGIEPSVDGGRIEVSAEPWKDGVVIYLKDDGVGFDPSLVAHIKETGDEGLHIGIGNTRRRLALLYGEDRELVRIDSAPGTGTRIRIEMPGRLVDESSR